MTRLDCSQAKAYEIIKRLTDQLKADGYITVAGRVPRAYFEEKCLLGGTGDADS
ncbi:transcriptional regulator [Clostridia bacterium OttesenSCG-928-O13]|nr:transcriptional regulator [Clostridia bacterium OttesenSCG-928-O13]